MVLGQGLQQPPLVAAIYINPDSSEVRSQRKQRCSGRLLWNRFPERGEPASFKGGCRPMVNSLFNLISWYGVQTRHERLADPVQEYESVLKELDQCVHAALCGRVQQEVELRPEEAGATKGIVVVQEVLSL